MAHTTDVVVPENGQTPNGQVPNGKDGTGASGPRIQPFLDAYETSDELRVVLDMPGLDSSQLDIGFEDSVLTIEGKAPAADNSRRYLHRGYRRGDFYRTLRIGEEIDVDQIGAEYIAGVLTIHLPKLAAAKRRKITVK